MKKGFIGFRLEDPLKQRMLKLGGSTTAIMTEAIEDYIVKHETNEQLALAHPRFPALVTMIQLEGKHKEYLFSILEHAQYSDIDGLFNTIARWQNPPLLVSVGK